MIENLYGESAMVAQLANLASPYAIRVAATLRLADVVDPAR